MCFIVTMLQVEKAKNHYNGKKQLLQKIQEEVMDLKHSLEVKDQEMKAIIMEKKLLRHDLEKVQTNEKTLQSKVASLEVGILF